MFYYIHAIANSGKEITRPLVAPVGHFQYEVKDCEGDSNKNLNSEISFEAIYPKPANATTVIPVTTSISVEAEITLTCLMNCPL